MNGRVSATQFVSIEMERAVIGACLTRADCIDDAAATGIDRATFQDPKLAAAWDIIVDLHAAGHAVDALTVANRAQGYDVATLTEYASHDGYRLANAGEYAARLVEMQRQRHVVWELEKCLNGSHGQWRQIIDNLTATVDGWNATTQKEGLFVDARQALEGGRDGDPPSVGKRSDNACAFWYAGKLNSINGESESGKSWLVQSHAAQEIAEGRHVVYLDFEKDAPTVFERLVLLGADEEAAVEFFHYKRVEDAWDAATLAALRSAVDELAPSLFVVDGVTNAMQTEGLDINSNNDVSRFYAGVPAIGRVAGSAVVLIDHLVKSVEGRGKGAIGAQHKRAGIDGATIRMTMSEPAGRNRTGTGRLTIDKDAPGWLREHAPDGKTIGDITIHSDGDSTTVTVVGAAVSGVTRSDDGAPRLTGFMERVSKVLEGYSSVGASGRTICKQVKGRSEHVLAALRTLIKEGYVRAERQGSSMMHYSVKAYREEFDTIVQPHGDDADSAESDDWGDQPYN